MAKGLCWKSKNFFDKEEQEWVWRHCRKPAEHLGEHVHPASGERWENKF